MGYLMRPKTQPEPYLHNLHFVGKVFSTCFPCVSLPQKWKNYCPEFSAYLSNHTVTNADTSGMITVSMEIFKRSLLLIAVPFASCGLHAWRTACMKLNTWFCVIGDLSQDFIFYIKASVSRLPSELRTQLIQIVFVLVCSGLEDWLWRKGQNCVNNSFGRGAYFGWAE